jgi:hypothetical protein
MRFDEAFHGEGRAALRIRLPSAVVAGVAAAFVAPRLGPMKWAQDIETSVRALSATSVVSPGQVVSFEGIEDVPPPVQRYFRYALREGAPLVRAARIRHEGQFQMRPNGGWKPFTSTQHFSSQPPGFVWDARIRMFPLTPVFVRDSYVDGSASMLGKVLSMLTVVNQQGGADLNAGALMRYLAESAWFPTALLPREGLEWSAIDDDRALATLTDGATKVSLEFRFNGTGQIDGVLAPERSYPVNGRNQPTPWAGYFWSYEERNGMMVPMEGKVEWQLPEGVYPYWTARIAEVEYEMA